ncbi:MAG: hypothetical protein K1562_11075 [Candidatus Thiodiazotropha sp. (ex. Lucinisca nassula)]|nr:hypothetical protein [Candidatus Thiodiazotropha sp. (ex. Lucinisca nassula)]
MKNDLIAHFSIACFVILAAFISVQIKNRCSLFETELPGIGIWALPGMIKLLAVLNRAIDH